MEREIALARMMRLCSRGEHCSGDVSMRLKRLEAEDAEGILAFLVKEKYIDDRRYASAFARDKSSLEGWGCAKISVALQRKGISREIVTEALGEIDRERAWKRLEALMAVRMRELGREADPLMRKRKIFRYAMGRGYGCEEIRAVYDALSQTDTESDT